MRSPATPPCSGWPGSAARRFQRQIDAAMRRGSVAEAMDLIGSSAPVLLVVGRYVPGLRFVVTATCALAPYPYPTFLLWSSMGGTLWSIVTSLTAYLRGTALGDHSIAALVLSGLVSTFAVAIVFVLIRRHRAARSAAVVTSEPA